MFLGYNYAVLIPTTIIKDKTNDNVIYFSDDHINRDENRMYGNSSSGVYNIRDKSITQFPLNNIYRHIYRKAKQPIFVDVNLSSLRLV